MFQEYPRLCIKCGEPENYQEQTMDNIKLGADQMAGDGNYSLGTPENYLAFVHNREMSVKIAALRKIRKSMQQQDLYISKLPKEFQELMFDNDYANQASHQVDVLLKALFGSLYEDVAWFLYEFEAGKTPGPHLRLATGAEYVFLTDEDYFKYLEQYGKRLV